MFEFCSLPVTDIHINELDNALKTDAKRKSFKKGEYYLLRLVFSLCAILDTDIKCICVLFALRAYKTLCLLMIASVMAKNSRFTQFTVCFLT